MLGETKATKEVARIEKIPGSQSRIESKSRVCPVGKGKDTRAEHDQTA